MRLKIVLTLHPESSGVVLPITYQFDLNSVVTQMLTAEPMKLGVWCQNNHIAPDMISANRIYAVSNLYIPHVLVEGDRLTIRVPRIQFWISFMHDEGTAEFVSQAMLNKTFKLGDRFSKVEFEVTAVTKISSAEYRPVMEYTTLSPITVEAMRPDRTLEYLSPLNPLFGQFIVEGLMERYERIMGHPWEGDVSYRFELLGRPKRKGVTMNRFTPNELHIIGWMLRFRFAIHPQLQRLAYELGIGDKIDQGFGYIELLDKKA